MAKYNYGLAGSSSHVHNSLWSADGKTPLFFDREAPWTLSELGRQWSAGQLKYAKDYTYFLAPYVNSYKRFQSGTFAPTKIMWSEDNRTAGFRLCGEGTKGIRMECRIGGADLNPYLAFAALIAAGLAGIDEKLELQQPFAGDAYQRRAARDPKTLRDATVTLAESRMLRSPRRGGGGALPAHRALGADGIRPPHHRLGIAPGLREILAASTCPVPPPARPGNASIGGTTDMTETVKLKSPIDGSIYAECPVADDKAVSAAVERARAAQADWARTSIAERGKVRAGHAGESRRHERRDRARDRLADGRPVRYGGEFGGVKERTQYMVEIAEQALKPVLAPIPKEGFRRYVKREPLGVSW